MSMDTIRFKADKRLRDKLFTAESYQHPAKMALGLVQEIASRYDIQPGSWVLDPMAGSGSTLILALQGINVIAVELEPHFVAPMLASWEKMKQHPMLGYALGEALILRGDARCLALNSADHAIFSPPYEHAVHETTADPSKVVEPRGRQGPNSQLNRAARHESGYTRPVDAIITSPPYEEHHQGGQDPHPEKMSPQGRQAGHTAQRYSVDAIVTSPPYEGAETRDRYPVQEGSISDVMTRSYLLSKHTRPVDAIVTSPSYGDTNVGRSESLGEAPFGGPNSQARGATYAPSRTENVGNLRGQAYWDSMAGIYSECHRVLRPGGLLVLVLKGFTREGQYVDLPQQTADLVESLGFVKFDEWRRELWALSFWRILQRRRSPETFDDRLNYETVLAFRKEPRKKMP